MIPFRYNIRSLLARKATTAATALGIALVVFVLATVLMASAGIDKTLGSSGRADNAVVLRKGSDAELNSNIDAASVGLILAAPGAKLNDKGAPVGVGEVVVVLALEKIGDPGFTNVLLRGVPDDALAFRSGARVTSGRSPKPGSDEALIGKRLQGRFKGFQVGQSFELRKNRQVSVVGIFEDDGSSFESEVWADIDTVRSGLGREGLVSSVRVRLESASKFEAFKGSVESDKNLGFEVMREPEFLEKQASGLRIFVTALGGVLAVFASVGAMVGAMITMYGSIASRQREIGTLRALGFPRWQILLAFMLECALLSVCGGTVGALAATGLRFGSFSMVNFTSWSEMVFTFQPTISVIATSLIAALAMGILGGFLPAIRAARVSPIQAMR